MLTSYRRVNDLKKGESIMKAKKIFTLAMAAVLTLALLAGCGAAAPAADPTAAPAADAPAT